MLSSHFDFHRLQNIYHYFLFKIPKVQESIWTYNDCKCFWIILLVTQQCIVMKSGKLFKNSFWDLFYFCTWVFCLDVYLCTTCVPGACGFQKKVLDLFNPALQIFTRCHVGTRNPNQVLCKTNNCSQSLTTSPTWSPSSHLHLLSMCRFLVLEEFNREKLSFFVKHILNYCKWYSPHWRLELILLAWLVSL